MAAPTMESTSILTSFLQYPPVSLVDDIINAVNEIMYRCTAAMEKYLIRKSIVQGKDYTEEIKIGMAKLETLLEYSVDKNFDKLELYILRNVLRIPQDLLDTKKDVFRLPYQRGLVIVNEREQRKNELEFQDTVLKIEEEFSKNIKLKSEIIKVKKLIIKVKKFKNLVQMMIHCNKDETKYTEIFNSLKPLDDTMKFLTNQLQQLYIDSEENCSTEEIMNILGGKTALKQKEDEVPDSMINNEQTDILSAPRPNSRSQYIESATQTILNSIRRQIGEINIKSNTIAVAIDEMKNTRKDTNEFEVVVEDADVTLLKKIE
ncbi:MIND complex subunit MTW1 NDAI_0H01180 [Naumovozyma dairenensis CBS 421]|uniref:Kinetochore-associated protein MTW1 n=1 Tax=Naumovozyma dairenensis (strain ATCC 10597 / BCRC 20456 / CBS 421 / NBRC 0211 / NRRL Y-12639) TaxID=1071378 RepID=G0WET1_NAUDC|nr:hypothetical protein NDAI_0H01180 [Naumovozyma dairenensis CBS 421]CCD26292.1 hypothetical protein NDAI_0H01180 [Naumovozyma dairenensis CBS 421]